MARRRDEAIADWIDEEVGGGGLTLAAWGFATVAAFVLGFASWQYAPARSPTIETARADGAAPDPSEITGSIANSDRGQTTVQPSRTHTGIAMAPMPLGNHETVATSRDIEALRSDIREIQRRIVQMGLSGDAVSRRIDRLDERTTNLAAAAPREATAANPVIAANPVATEATSKPADAPTAERVVERLPTPIPKPVLDASAAPTPGTYDAEGPTTTGAVPKSALEKTDAAPKSAKSPVTLPPVSTTAAPPAVTSTASPPAIADAPTPVPTVRMVATAPAATPSVTLPPAAETQAAIDLGGYRTLASLRRSWADMTLRYGDLSKGLEPLARLRETDSGMEARLLAGPFANQTEAAKVCMRLKASGATCTVATYGGQPIAGMR